MSSIATGSRSPGTAKWRIGVVVVVLVFVSAAMAGCPSPIPPTRAITPTGTVTVMALVTATLQEEAWPVTWTPTVTFTPWPPTATFTPTSTSVPYVYVAGSPCSTSRASTGPLRVTYKTESRWCPSRYTYVAEMTVSASGGDGCYTYYRDIDKIAGPTSQKSIPYQLKWAACGGAPGTFFVKSRDGQEAKVLFWVHPPSCCR